MWDEKQIHCCDAYEIAQALINNEVSLVQLESVPVFAAKARLVEEAVWDLCKSNNTISGYDKYLNIFPNGIHAEEARMLLRCRIIVDNSHDERWKSDFIAKEECTDVFFFGINTTGKTSLLEGLMGCNGQGCSFDFDIHGGTYANALFQLLERGLLPEPTLPFFTTINGSIEERTSRYQTINHAINLVELDGYTYFNRFVDCKDRNLNLKEKPEMLYNNNRKIFFLIVDPTLTYDEPFYDTNRNRINDNPCKKFFYYQMEGIVNFISLFELPENEGFMKNVDAVHFIVTKADTLGKTQKERNRKAHKLLMDKYRGAVYALMFYCQRTKRINRTTDFQPRIFTFSLGKFYLDGFEYDSKDSLYLIDALSHMTYGKKEPTFLNKVHKSLAVVQPTRCDYGVEINFE